MNLRSKGPQLSAQAERAESDRGEASKGNRREEALLAKHENERSGPRSLEPAAEPKTGELMELVCERENLRQALKRVKKNKGSAGIDGMTVEELPDYLREHWIETRERLLTGQYLPSAVRRVTIPKSDGGERELGIPTVLDRFIQQAVLQVLQPRFDKTFSKHSYGFRPGKRAHDAVCEAQRYIQEGRRYVVDVDLEKFFDRVNHDVLMSRLAKRIEDKRLLALIRRYLEAGVMLHGVVMERHEGTPQGGPLSPLLANVLLDEVDKKLEARGHAFVRYADDCNVYVRSARAGERVMKSLRRFFGALRLRINESKSAVARASQRKFLGYSFWYGGGKTKRRVSDKSLAAMKQRVRWLTRRTRGRSIDQIVQELRTYLLGWRNYFKLADTPRVLNELDEWIRHRLRAIHLKHWRRGTTIFRELKARGLSQSVAARVAANGRRWWRNSAMAIHIALPNRYFEKLGIPRLGG